MPLCRNRPSALPFILWLLSLCHVQSAGPLPAPPVDVPARSFAARGIVCETRPADAIIVIRHEAISNYMAAMTMPFKVKNIAALAGLQRGGPVAFQHHVAENESWVDGLIKPGLNWPR
jgi:Cu/Ag efflux protein CusF